MPYEVNKIDTLFIKYLKEEEKILWSGQPKQGVQLRDADMILIPMTIILFGFSLILNYSMFFYDSPWMLKIIGVFLAGSAIYMGVIRFFLSSGKRARTFYCITNKRVIVIVIKGKRKQGIQTLPLKNIEQMDVIEEKDRSGFIIFGNTNPLYPWLLGGFYFVHDTLPGLEVVPEVKSVYQIIHDQIRVNITPSLIEEVKRENREEYN